MASAPDELQEQTWSDLEQGFFASAPPETPAPPAEPLRFDDLDPAPLPRPTRLARLRDVRTAATAVAVAARRRASALGHRAQPALRRVRRRLRAAMVIARRRWRPAWTAARPALARLSSAAAARLRAWLPDDRPDMGAIASAIASVLFVMGLSAGVVASRGNARTMLPVPAARVAPGAAAAFGDGAPTRAPGPARLASASSPPEAPLWGPPPPNADHPGAAAAGPAEPARAAPAGPRSHKTNKRPHRHPPAARLRGSHPLR